MIDFSNFNGLREASEDYNNFDIVSSKGDPNVWGVYILLIQFGDGSHGLCIYNCNSCEFVEEPGDLEDYCMTLEEVKEKYNL